MKTFDDERLAAVLADIGDQLRIETAVETAVKTARHRTPFTVGSLRWVAALVVVILVLAVVVAPVRHGVADWFGIGSTDIDIDPEAASVTSLPSIVVGLDPVSDATAERLLGQALPALDGSDLGAPSGLARMPEGGVLVVWPDASTLWIRAADTELPERMRKIASSLDQVVKVDDLGEEALVITGDHMLETPHRRLAATAVVLWRSNGLELRLEADRPADALVELARALERSGAGR